MDITNYSWWYETLNKVIFQTDFIVMNMYIQPKSIYIW
jgi:hypothetical protein